MMAKIQPFPVIIGLMTLVGGILLVVGITNYGLLITAIVLVMIFLHKYLEEKHGR